MNVLHRFSIKSEMSNANDEGSLNQKWCTLVNFIIFISFYSAVIITEVFGLLRKRRKLIYDMVQFLKRLMFLVEELQAEVSVKEAAARLLREDISVLSGVRNQ